MFESLEILISLEHQRQEIEKIIRDITEPLLHDVVFIQHIHEMVRDIKGLSKSEERQLFILLVLLFYSPKKIVIGMKINKRVMKEMCHVTGCSQALLSFYSKDLVFLYHHYKKFRDCFEYALDKAADILVSEGVDRNKLYTYIGKFKYGA